MREERKKEAVKRYLLPEQGQFYKANLHCHSSVSDGNKTPEELKEHYKKLGYSIVAYTDHEVMIPHPELSDDTFLALNGAEMSVMPERKPDVPLGKMKGCHFGVIALEPDNHIMPCWHRSKYLRHNAEENRKKVLFDDTLPDFEREYSPEGVSKMMQAFAKEGFFVIYNHPTVSFENYADYINYHGMHALEMFNGASICDGWDEYNPRVYDDILRSGRKLYCVGGDDNHNCWPDDSRRSDSGWAYTVIKAKSLDYRTVTRALQDGEFYASEGPEIYGLWYEDGKVHIKCSPCDRINFVGSYRFTQTVLREDAEVCEASFDLPESAEWFRLTVIDERGRRACTNAYFTEDLKIK